MSALPPTALPKILCVDDEPQVLEGLILHLRRKFQVVTAAGGGEALEKLKSQGPFLAVVSDMRMPGMSGAELLKQVRALAPDTMRLLLTGQADMVSAISAVNDGQIFRFLTKPCPPPTLLAALDAATAQHRLVTAERELLELTLRGTVRMLGDVLALANPLAFGKVVREKALVEVMLSAVAPAELWKAEVACLFTRLGTINLSPTTLEKWYRGDELSPEDRAQTDKLPQATEAFLSHIPRLDSVRDIVSSLARGDGASAPIGARALRLAFDFETLRCRGDSDALALETLRGRTGQYDEKLLEVLAAHLHTNGGPKVREVSTKEIRAGMVLTEDVKTKAGMLLVPRGFEITLALQLRLASMADGAVKEPIRVQIR